MHHHEVALLEPNGDIGGIAADKDFIIGFVRVATPSAKRPQGDLGGDSLKSCQASARQVRTWRRLFRAPDYGAPETGGSREARWYA